MYGDVNVSIEDGNLGRSSNTGVGTQIKIGISNVESSSPILITGTMNSKKIIEKLGHSPLADACMDSVEWGANTIYGIPVKADLEGTIESVVHTGSGEGTITITGKPYNHFDIIIEIIESGNTNVGTCRYSIDNGTTYTEEMTIPISKTLQLGETGLTASFTELENMESFLAADTYLCSTTAPSMSNQSVISAVETLIHSSTAYEFIHIVGTSSKALWASLASLAHDFATKYKRPVFFVCEARSKRSDETMDEYFTAMQEERKGIHSIYLQVVLSNIRYQRKDLRIQDINAAGIITGMYCLAKESQSIGEVKSFPISSTKILQLLPVGIEDYIKPFDQLKYTTIRQYVSKEDYYVTSANMMSPEGSDYSYAEDIRVSNRIVKAVRAKALDELQTEVDPTNIDASVAAIEAQLNIPIEDAEKDKVISTGSVTIDVENLNILVDESMDIRVSYVPYGHVRSMNITFSTENPFASER